MNYAIDGPAHRIFFGSFPRRVRATLGDTTVFDTVNGKLLHALAGPSSGPARRRNR